MNDDRQGQAGSDHRACCVAKCVGTIKLSHLGLLVLVFGLLLWARFLLVTGHPRTAIADPPANGPGQHAAVATAPVSAP